MMMIIGGEGGHLLWLILYPYAFAYANANATARTLNQCQCQCHAVTSWNDRLGRSTE